MKDPTHVKGNTIVWNRFTMLYYQAGSKPYYKENDITFCVRRIFHNTCSFSQKNSTACDSPLWGVNIVEMQLSDEYIYTMKPHPQYFNVQIAFLP